MIYIQLVNLTLDRMIELIITDINLSLKTFSFWKVLSGSLYLIPFYFILFLINKTNFIEIKPMKNFHSNE
jgi:hypothetical protein